MEAHRFLSSRLIFLRWLDSCEIDGKNEGMSAIQLYIYLFFPVKSFYSIIIYNCISLWCEQKKKIVLNKINSFHRFNNCWRWWWGWYNWWRWWWLLFRNNVVFNRWIYIYFFLILLLIEFNIIDLIALVLWLHWLVDEKNQTRSCPSIQLTT